MTKRRKPDEGVEAEAERAPERRRRKRRLIWPLVLASALAASSWTIAQAATLPPLPVAEAAAHGPVADAAQAPIDAVVPTAGPVASAQPAPFGPQLEVILPPPPPPPPPASSGQRSSPQQKQAAAAALTTTQYCDGKYGATTSASTPQGLLTAANAERANFGLAPLSWSGTLAQSAQDWSNTMAGNYDPTNPGAAMGHGMVPSPGGQNVAAAWTSGSMSQATAIATAHSGWMASPGHCENILRASFTSMGAGTAEAGSGKAWYTTVDFQ
ncbi:CAP domain-containing protein [Demequina lutea]|uniref:Uncharacterized protein YkwD n=1 Tax=Demequina lutea TaxID=431489 RepID=A0A7Y9ZAA5_9MICO|nr:CAP domain-containing protein [Demequina lutea]NYI40568.1 uncharacterized protein YkwD [Demequina lutea]